MRPYLSCPSHPSNLKTYRTHNIPGCSCTFSPVNPSHLAIYLSSFFQQFLLSSTFFHIYLFVNSSLHLSSLSTYLVIPFLLSISFIQHYNFPYMPLCHCAYLRLSAPYTCLVFPFSLIHRPQALFLSQRIYLSIHLFIYTPLYTFLVIPFLLSTVFCSLTRLLHLPFIHIPFISLSVSLISLTFLSFTPSI